MQIRLDILRQKSAGEQPYTQSILFEGDSGETVAHALMRINSGEFSDVNGESVSEVRWEHSCLQKKCGACAMVIGGKPRLACGARLGEFADKGAVTVEPLRKFPVIADLLVDRSAVFDALKELKVWAEREVPAPESTDENAYDAARCLQCGCCLEVCPNFYAGGEFFGMAAAMPASRLIGQLDRGERQELSEGYKKHVYSGCGKSLACRNICPAGIDIERQLVNSNAAAVWRGLFRRKK